MSTYLDPAIAERLARNDQGLVPAVVQSAKTHEVLMVAWMDDEALHRTLTTGRTTFWSRSRKAYWVKGETSGNIQHVREVRLDCDGDTLLVKVDQVGPACHTGAETCFDEGGLPIQHGAEGELPIQHGAEGELPIQHGAEGELPIAEAP